MFVRQLFKAIFILSIIAVAGCSSGPEEVSFDFNVTLNGEPAADAVITIDDEEVGKTDSQGLFKKVVMKERGNTIKVMIDKKVDGHRVEAWTQEINFNDDSDDEFKYTADLTAVAVITIKALDGKSSVKDAVVYVGKTKVGKTDENGEITYDMPTSEKKKFTIKVDKYGYSRWRKTITVSPGDTVKAAIPKQLIIRVSALSELYGDKTNVRGLKVSLDGQVLGETNKSGEFKVTKRGRKGKKGTLVVSAPGYLPEKVVKKINLEGSYRIKKYFYPQKQEPVRVALFRFVSNTAGEDIGDIPFRFQQSIEQQVNKRDGFVIVENEQMMVQFKKAKLTPEKAKEKGWKKTQLYKHVDVIGFGSISKDIKGQFIVETNFYSASGGLVFSQIATAKNSGRIDRASKEIVIGMEEAFPFAGRVLAKDDNEYRINLGDGNFSIDRGDMFTAYNPVTDKYGRIKSYKEVGALKVSSARSNYSKAEIERIDSGVKLQAGAKVVRQSLLDDKNMKFVTVAVKSDVRGEVIPLQGVNIYLDEKWMGATDKNGKAKVPVTLKKSYDISLYRHGFSQIKEDIKVDNNAELKEYMLDSYYSLLTVESEPSGADVFIDDIKIGRTPITKGEPVSTGFHTVRLSVGGDWRDWEEVMEFTTDEVNWTGDYAVYFDKDYLRLGTKAMNSGDIDGAISIFDQAKKEHPDYAEIRHTLAQLYLDEKKDPVAAVKEFEKVMTVPEVRELVFKQFAVVYTNMGRAYHAKADSLLHTDKKAAAQNFARAIKALGTAKENARFFPAEYYDEAVHDTYYYIALSYHKLYQISQKATILNKAELAWRDYMDFFPESLINNPQYLVSKESAESFMEQLKQN